MAYVPPHRRVGAGAGAGAGATSSTATTLASIALSSNRARVAIALLCDVATATKLVEGFQTKRGRAAAVVLLDFSQLFAAGGGGGGAAVTMPLSVDAQTAFIARAIELIPRETLEYSQSKVPGSGADVNGEFLTHFLAPHAAALAESGAVLVSIVERAAPPTYPSCDIVGFAAMGYVDNRIDSSMGGTGANAVGGAEHGTAMVTIARDLLEEAGIAIADWAALLDDTAAPLPLGVPRFIDVPQGVVTRKPLTIYTVRIPADWCCEPDVINAAGKPASLADSPHSLCVKVDKPDLHAGYAIMTVGPPQQAVKAEA